MKLIHLVSDPLAESISVNKRVAASFLEKMQSLVADLSVEEIDLYRDPPPFYGPELFRYVWEPVSNPGYRPSSAEKAAAQYMLRHAELLRGADLLLVSAPLWNYYLPAALKAWIDQVLSPGQMFDLGADGRVPRHRIRAMVSVVSAGGIVSAEDVACSLFYLLRETFRYAGIERQHELLVEGVEPALYADHAEREREAIDAAERLAVAVAGEPAGVKRA